MSIEMTIPNFRQEVKALEELAKAGFVMGFGISQTGPEFLLNRYPKRWQRRYDERAYHSSDPILIWTITSNGTSRWSDMTFGGVPIRNLDADKTDFLDDAARFGLRYGVSITRVMADKRRSFIVLSHSDREFTDVEIASVETKFEGWAERMARPLAELGPEAIELLRYLREGMDYAQIAVEMNIAPSTVKHRVVRICDKMNVSNKIQAVALAQARGYLDR